MTKLPKESYAQFKALLLVPPDGYNNRLTVHVRMYYCQ